MCENLDYQPSSTLTSSPSFGQPPNLHASLSSPPEPYEDAITDDFEFSLLIPDSETHYIITADDIFSDGRIRPIYPVLSDAFRNKPKRPQLLQLLMEEHDSSASEASSSFADELEGIPKGTYCLWPPEQSQGSVRKCCSAGSLFGLWVRGLVLRRSNGGFGEKRSTEKKADAEGGRNKGKEMDPITAHQLHYGRSGRGRSRKSFLPYKEIGGFFHRAG